MAEPLFTAPPADLLIRVPFDGIMAVYHRASTMTHIIAEPAPEILDALAGRSLSLSGLLQALDVDEDEGSVAALRVRLDELEAGGLVSRS